MGDAFPAQSPLRDVAREIGRRFGLAGRLFQQAIFVADNLLAKGDTVSGWVLVPQEGNTVAVSDER